VKEKDERTKKVENADAALAFSRSAVPRGQPVEQSRPEFWSHRFSEQPVVPDACHAEVGRPQVPVADARLTIPGQQLAVGRIGGDLVVADPDIQQWTTDLRVMVPWRM